VRFITTPEEIECLIDWQVLPAWSSSDPNEIEKALHKILAALRRNAFEKTDLVGNEDENDFEL